jgi:hypothetical protein
MRSFTEHGSEGLQTNTLPKNGDSVLFLVRGLFNMLQKLILLSSFFKNEEEAKEEEFCYTRKRASCLFPGKKYARRPFLTQLRGRKAKKPVCFLLGWRVWVLDDCKLLESVRNQCVLTSADPPPPPPGVKIQTV